jgi:hypothetical protein
MYAHSNTQIQTHTPVHSESSGQQRWLTQGSYYVKVASDLQVEFSLLSCERKFMFTFIIPRIFVILVIKSELFILRIIFGPFTLHGSFFSSFCIC